MQLLQKRGLDSPIRAREKMQEHLQLEQAIDEMSELCVVSLTRKQTLITAPPTPNGDGKKVQSVVPGS